MLMEPGRRPQRPARSRSAASPRRITSSFTTRTSRGATRRFSSRRSPSSTTPRPAAPGSIASESPPNQARPLEPHAFVALGPVVVPVALVQQLGQALGAMGQMARRSSDRRRTAVSRSGRRAGHARRAGQPRSERRCGAEGEAQDGHRPGAARRRRRRHSARRPSAARRKTTSRSRTRRSRAGTPCCISVGGQLFLEDRGSANGTYVRGQRIPPGQRVPVAERREGLHRPDAAAAPGRRATRSRSSSRTRRSWAGRPLYEIEAWDLVLAGARPRQPGELKTLLDHVSFKALPGDFIALMGPSGAGKTTLLAHAERLPAADARARCASTARTSTPSTTRCAARSATCRRTTSSTPSSRSGRPCATARASACRPTTPRRKSTRRVQHHARAARPRERRAPADRQAREEDPLRRSAQARQHRDGARDRSGHHVPRRADERSRRRRHGRARAACSHDLAKQTGKTIITTIHQPAKDEFEKFNLALILGAGGVHDVLRPARATATASSARLLERQGKPNRVDNPRDMFDMLNQRERPIFERDARAEPERAALHARASRRRASGTPSTSTRRTRSSRRCSRGGARSARAPRSTACRSAAPSTAGSSACSSAATSRSKMRDVGGTVDHAAAGADHRRAAGARVRRAEGRHSVLVPRRAAGARAQGRAASVRASTTC